MPDYETPLSAKMKKRTEEAKANLKKLKGCSRMHDMDLINLIDTCDSCGAEHYDVDLTPITLNVCSKCAEHDPWAELVAAFSAALTFSNGLKPRDEKEIKELLEKAHALLIHEPGRKNP